jgi:carbonic anhydrase/acetyltransferase-like protein (isoleucine patch superfamily)
MIRKAAIPSSILLVVILSALVAACGSDAQQSQDAQGSQSGSAQGGAQLTNIGRPPKVVFGTSYVGPLTEIFGDVLIGQHDFVASNSIMRAAPGNRVTLGNESNVQDNVSVRALNRSVTIGDRTSLTHHATVLDSDIGNFVFVGYNAEIRNSEVGDGAFIYHGAVVDGVKIPEKSFVGPGVVVSDQQKADALPKTDQVDLGKYYNRKEQLDTNREFAKAYIDLYRQKGFDAIVEVGPNPKTPWNPEEKEPQIGKNVELQDFVRVTGDVQIGDNSSIGSRSAIRADEGDPISIGPGAAIDDRVTVHATRGSAVRIGTFLVANDDSVLHGPLQMGDRDTVGENAVVFRARLGDNVQVGEGAIIAGPVVGGGGTSLEIPDGTLVPAGAVITSQKDVQALKQS